MTAGFVVTNESPGAYVESWLGDAATVRTKPVDSAYHASAWSELGTHEHER